MKGNSILDRWQVSTAILLLLLLSVVALWLWLPRYLTSTISNLPYGSSYDALGALFTGLAFAGLVFTIFLQQRQIKLQREDFLSQLEEMKMSREEIARQVNVQEKHLYKSWLGDIGNEGTRDENRRDSITGPPIYGKCEVQ